MDCRPGCGACCVAVSISSPLPGLPNGKPAGSRCPHLTPERICALWATPAFPDICRRFQATPDFCGEDRFDALIRINKLEQETDPR